MMPSKQPQASLFQVYLRLRPPIAQKHDENERFLTVESPETSQNDGEIVAPVPTHITLQPPSDSRKRAIEKFGFTKVFEENASQLDVFHDTGMESLVRGVLKENRDGLVATLGVTGSGKVGIPCSRAARTKLIWRGNTEPHHPRIQVPARSYPNGPRCHLPVTRAHSEDRGRQHQSHDACLFGRIGCIRGAAVLCPDIPGSRLRRSQWWSQLESPNSHEPWPCAHPTNGTEHPFPE